MKDCGVSLHSIDHASLIGNINWFLDQPWIDERLRPLFKSGLALGGTNPPTGSHRRLLGRHGAGRTEFLAAPGFHAACSLDTVKRT